MCSYNMAPYIGAQLDSLARQNRMPDELVVCDDGSLDETVAIVRRFATLAPFPVWIFENEERLGCNKNFDKAISLCQGDIIFLCDHDDIWRPDKIALIADMMQDERTGAAFGDAAVVAADLAPLGFTLWDTCDFNPERRDRFAAGAQFSELMRNNVMQGAAAAFRASFRNAIMPIPKEWQHDYWIALLVSASSEIRFTERCVLEYRQHGRNLIGAGQPFRDRPETRYRRLRQRLQSWIKKARSQQRYYAERLTSVERELAPLKVLLERLQSLDPDKVGAALAQVERKLGQLQAWQTVTQEKYNRAIGAGT